MSIFFNLVLLLSKFIIFISAIAAFVRYSTTTAAAWSLLVLAHNAAPPPRIHHSFCRRIWLR